MSPSLICSSASKPRAFLWPTRLHAILCEAIAPSSLLQPHWLLRVLTHMQHTSTSGLCTTVPSAQNALPRYLPGPPPYLLQVILQWLPVTKVPPTTLRKMATQSPLHRHPSLCLMLSHSPDRLLIVCILELFTVFIICHMFPPSRLYTPAGTWSMCSHYCILSF